MSEKKVLANRSFTDFVKEPTDAVLAEAARSGCVESFSSLMRRYQVPIVHFLQQFQRQSGCRGGFWDAEDVAQEAFLRAFQNLHRYDSRWAFSTWLFTIARRTCLNHLRLKRLPASNDSRGLLLVGSDASPLETAIAVEQGQLLWKVAADTLSEEQFTALWLASVEEMPLCDIAQVLERSLSSVKVMLFRSRKKLLPLLRDCMDEQMPRDFEHLTEDTTDAEQRLRIHEVPHV